jgi:hypothetical protein
LGAGRKGRLYPEEAKFIPTRSRTTFKKRQKELARVEKQRDKAAQRVQRKLAREAGISLDGTDEFGNPIDGVDETGNAIDGADPIDGPDETGDTVKAADEATGAKE